MTESIWPWARKAAVFLAGFGAFLDVYAPQAVLPLLSKTFHTSPATIGLTITVTTLAVALVAPFVGVVSDRVGRKRMIVPALALLAIPTALTALASSFGMLLAVRFAQGLIVPAVFGVTVAYIGEESEPGETGALMGTYSAGTVLGGFCGRFLTGLVADALGWRSSFIVLGAALLLVALIVGKLLPKERRFHSRASSGVIRGLEEQIHKPSILATCMVGFAVLFSLVGGFTYANFHLAAAPWNLGPSALASVFLVYLLGLVTTPIAGHIIDKVGPRMTIAGALGTGTLGILLTLIPSLPAIVLGLALLSSGAFVAQVCSSVYLMRAAPEARSTTAGLYFSLYYLGGSIGAFLPGLVWMQGGWTATVVLVAIVELTALSMAWMAWSKVGGKLPKLPTPAGLYRNSRPLEQN